LKLEDLEPNLEKQLNQLPLLPLLKNQLPPSQPPLQLNQLLPSQLPKSERIKLNKF
jgi:hypothetical protein